MKRVIFREKLIQVVIEDDSSVSIQKCDGCDNFDDHGSDWEIPLDSIDQAKLLIQLLTKAIESTQMYF